MNNYKQLEKNTVESQRQLRETEVVKFINPNGKGKRIMFAGNSITLHGVKEDIGWNNCWGMAASEKENDYVHRLIKSIDDKEQDCAYCICQISTWEVNYKNGKSTYSLYKNAKNFQADIIVFRAVENCPYKDTEQEVFKKELWGLLNYLSGEETEIILTTGFWHHPLDKGIIELSEEKSLPLAELGDLGEDDEMKAIGLFEHNGVANHPGDKGMKKIAERIFKVIEKYI